MIKFKKRDIPTRVNKYVIAAILFIMAITYYLSSPGICKLYAATVNDYCYKFNLNVTNTSFLSYSDKPVLLENVNMGTWQSENYIDRFGWSIFPYQGSLTTEYEVTLQDINNASSNQWYVMPVIQPGDNQLSVLIGASDIQRNQGLYFAGLDYGQISNHSDFSQDNFNIKIEFQDYKTQDPTLSYPTITQTLIDKYDEDNSQGILLEYIRNHTDQTAVIKATIDGSELNSINFTPTNLNQIATFSLTSGGLLSVGIDGTTSSTGAVTYTPNTEDVYIGVNYETSLATKLYYLEDITMRFISFDNEQLGIESQRATYGFNPADILQSSAANPNYAGTVEDISQSANNHVYSYYFNRDQTYIAVSASAIVPSTSSGSTIFTSASPDIVGRWFGSSNPGNLLAGNANFFGFDFLTPPAGLGLPDNFWYSMYLSSIGLILAMGMFWVFQSVLLSLFGASVPLVLGAIQGMIAPEFVVIWFLLFLAIYSSTMWYERG